MTRKFVAELLGTFWLVFGGCGTAVFAGGHVGFLGVALAFGLTVLTMAYAIGHVSGCHLNPAVSVGLVAGGRMPAKELPLYISAQVIGGILGAAVLMFILKGMPGGWEAQANSFAANGYGEHSPDHYGMVAALIAEAVLTFFFLIVILGATDTRSPGGNTNGGFAGVAIGLALTLIHLIGIPITNTSVNPARSTSQALFVGGWALEQLWLFWLAPIVGAILAGLVFKFLRGEPKHVLGSD